MGAVKIGPVGEDSRGKIGRDGSREHIFAEMRPGGNITIHRFADREWAERERAKLVREHAAAN